MKKIFVILSLVAFFAICAVVIAQQAGLIPPGVLTVDGPYPIYSCTDTDNGPNIYQAANGYGLMPGANNSVVFYNFTDYCSSSQVVQEGVCGSWIDANLGTIGWNSSGFIVAFNCSESNTINTTYSCLNGACVVNAAFNSTNSTGNSTGNSSNGGNNSTNATLYADLIVSAFNYSASWVNSTNTTNTYNVLLTATIFNNGTALAPNSTTRFGVFGSVNQTVFTPSIAVGSSAIVSRTFTLTSGNRTAFSYADILNVVNESNELNNDKFINFNLL